MSQGLANMLYSAVEKVDCMVCERYNSKAL